MVAFFYMGFGGSLELSACSYHISFFFFHFLTLGAREPGLGLVGVFPHFVGRIVGSVLLVQLVFELPFG